MKEYIQPEMEVVELNCQNELLSMSGGGLNSQDAGDGNEHFRLTVGAAAVHGHPSAFVAQTVALRGKLRQRLRGKICCRGGRGFAAGIGHRQAQLWQSHPEQAEHNGKYA